MSLVREILAALLLVAGSIFMLLAAIGVLRMPDLFMRMQAATKAAALGGSLMFLGAFVSFWQPEVSTRAVAAIIFVFLTLPIGAHLMARAAYLTGAQIWQGTKTGMVDPYETQEHHVVDDDAPDAEAVEGET